MLCLPAQLGAVAASIRGHIRRKCMVVSSVLGMDVRKLQQLFGASIVVAVTTVCERWC